MSLEEKSPFMMLGLSFYSNWIGALTLFLLLKLEYCYHVYAGAPSCYLEMLDELQKQICRTAGPSLAATLEPRAHRQILADLGLF